MPPETSAPNVTQLLHDWRGGSESARNDLFAAVHQELRRLAAVQMRGESGNTLQPTALVSEAYLRLVDASDVDWQDRAHFLSLAVRVMRRVLVDRARKRRADKRGGGRQPVTLQTQLGSAPERSVEVERVDAALQGLQAIHPRQARVIELRWFGGLEVKEVAVVLGVSTPTVKRDWAAGRLWLARELQRS